MGAEPPPPPQVSPDGRFYWDGQRWVPMPVPALPPQRVPMQATAPDPEERSGRAHPEYGPGEYGPGVTLEEMLDRG
jgi:hypothetical protein